MSKKHFLLFSIFAFLPVLSSEISDRIATLDRFSSNQRKLIEMLLMFSTPEEFDCYADAIVPNWKELIRHNFGVPPSMQGELGLVPVSFMEFVDKLNPGMRRYFAQVIGVAEARGMGAAAHDIASRYDIGKLRGFAEGQRRLIQILYTAKNTHDFIDLADMLVPDWRTYVHREMIVPQSFLPNLSGRREANLIEFARALGKEHLVEYLQRTFSRG